MNVATRRATMRNKRSGGYKTLSYQHSSELQSYEDDIDSVY